MSKVCIYTKPFPSVASYMEMIDIAVSYGLDAVEGFCQFEFSDPNVEAAKEIKKYADEKGVKFPCFSVFINLVGDDSAEMVERLKGYAEVAAELGSPYLHHTIACNYFEPEKIVPFKDELFIKGVGAVREVYDYAEKLGVKTIFEDQGFLFNGVEGFGKFLAEVNRDVGVVADFGNIYQSYDGIEDFIKAFSDKVMHAHVKDITLADDDKNGGLPTLPGKYMLEAKIGKGMIDIKGAINLLKEAGYDGYYGIEYGAPEDNSPKMDEAIKYVCESLK